MAVLLLFIDGVGLGDRASYNPWYALPTPHVNRLLDGQSLTKEAVGSYADGVQLVATDTLLGVPGLPQSATGQATIFTGRNAPKFLQRHMSGLPFQRLRQFVREDNLYLQLERAGLRPTFANAYTEEYFARPATKRGWMSVSTVAIDSAAAPLRFTQHLLQNRALFHDLTRAYLRQLRPDIAEVTPEEAAEHALALVSDYDLVVHEYFLSDVAGHKQVPGMIENVVDTYDRFLGHIAKGKRREDTVILVSDHGNSEDFRRRTHTMNEVPTLIVGPVPPLGEEGRASWDLTRIVPLIRRVLDVEHLQVN
ncbi:alkaline phosphatase family protein [Numidum massiliense]|uniref:alkaline phosphatase family protein n=1 Tax=Numidum massiliense TaxID=1522315 RepID=UPI0006D554A8|nr:alkaline phosphatase family protein [Numidum massiliense]